MKVLDIIKEDAAVVGTREDAIVAEWLKKNPHLGITEKYDPAAANFYTRFIANNKHINVEIMNGFQQRYGLAFGFLKAIGIIVPLYQCVVRLRALNEQAKEKDSSGQYVHSIEWIHSQENAIVGTFLASQLATVVVASIKAGTFITGLRGLLNAGAMRAPGGARAKIIAIVATNAGLTALSLWLSSPSGMEWCTTGMVVPLIVNGMGAFGNSMLEIIRDGIKDHLGADVGVVTPDINKRKDDDEADKTAPDADAIRKAQADAELRTRPGQIIR